MIWLERMWEKMEDEKEIRFLDLFGGIGGFRLGLEKSSCNSEGWRKKRIQTNTREGHDVSPENTTSPLFHCVGYYELDKYCVQVYNHRFKESHKPTDITAVKASDIPDHDLLCAGFPCQSFSIAGKRKGFQDIQGTMFFEICRILKEKRPRLCLLENVRGLLSADDGRCFHTILVSLDELGYDAEWQILNTKYHLPQNRERVFIVGHLRENGGCSREVFPIRQDDKAADKDRFIRGLEQIAQTLRARDYANWQGNFVQLPEIAGCLSGGGHSGGLHSDMLAIPCLTPDRVNKKQHGRRFKEDGEDMFTLTGQDVHGVRIQSHHPRCGNPKKGGTGLLESDEHCFTLHSSPHYVDRIRRLTPSECCFLQGFPADWTKYGIQYLIPETHSKDNGKKKKTNTLKILQVLWKTIKKGDGKGRGFTELVTLLKKEILQPRVYEESIQVQVERGCFESRRELQSKAISYCNRMFGLWKNEKSGYSPHRQKQIEQLFGKLKGSLSKLPHEIASTGRHLEQNPHSKQKTKHVGAVCFTEISDAQRYKMLGNAVTTNVIEAIGRRILGIK